MRSAYSQTADIITHAHFSEAGYHGFNTMGVGTEVYSKGKKKTAGERERLREMDCVCVCVCVFVRVYVVYEDTNLYNDMGMT